MSGVTNEHIHGLHGCHLNRSKYISINTRYVNYEQKLKLFSSHFSEMQLRHVVFSELFFIKRLSMDCLAHSSPYR